MKKPISVPTVVLMVVLGLALGVSVLMFLQQRSELRETRAEYEQLLQEARAGEGSPGPVSAAPGTAPGTRAPATGSVHTPPADSGQAPVALEQEPELGFFGSIQSTGLELAGTHVAPAPGGLKATMRFFPTRSESPGTIAVVVRLPREADSRILELQPTAGGMRFADGRMRVAEDGKFAIWTGSAENADTLEVGLTVSGETTADVRGTAGIGPFDLDITGIEATATPK